MLGISSEEFYWDISPVELYYAFQVVGEQREGEFKQQLIVSRMQARMIINGQLGMKQEYAITDDKKLGLFYWEEEGDKAVQSHKQSPEEMKTVLMNIVNTHNANLAKREAAMKRSTPPVTGKYSKKKK